MNMKDKNNKGFTLVELLVAVAISSIVVVMISTLIIQSSKLFKSESSVIDVHNEAQIVKNQLSEAMMEAKELTIVKSGDNVRIYTGKVDTATNRLAAETSGPEGANEVTTEKVITYNKETGEMYISSSYATRTDEGNKLSSYIQEFDIVVDESCKKTEDTGVEINYYYVNPLKINIFMKIGNDSDSTNADMTIKARNQMKRLEYYTASDIDTYLKDAKHTHGYVVK